MTKSIFIILTAVGGGLLILSCFSVPFVLKVTREFKDEGIKKYLVLFLWTIHILLGTGSVVLLCLGIFGLHSAG